MKALSARKVHILQLAAKGYTVKETASSLGVSRSAIEKHLIEIRLHFDAKNIASAVYKAVKTGVIIYACFSMVNTGEMRRNARIARVRQDSYIMSQESALS